MIRQFLYEMAWAFGFVFRNATTDIVTGDRRVRIWRPKTKFIPWYERW